MEEYLGEFPVDIASDPLYANWTSTDWALHYIERYGGIDGRHHKAWVLDQVARILLGTKVIVTQARWSNGQSEHRVRLADPTEKYRFWVGGVLGELDEDGQPMYTYDEGIPP